MITAQTTGTITDETWLVRTYDISIDEVKLSEVRELEGQYVEHQAKLQQGISEGWLVVLSTTDQTLPE